MTKVLCLGAIATTLAGCGGGSGGVVDATTYAFITPSLHSQRLSNQTIVDNSNNTINLTVLSTVTAVQGNGFYSVHVDNPNNDTVTVDGTTYSVLTEDAEVNASGQTLSFSYTSAAGTQVTCTESPHGAGPNYPVSVGEQWSLDFSQTCDGGVSISYVQTGSVVDVESVTVPAGTFMALKLQSTIVWTTPAGILRTESITNWRDVTNGLSVKEVVNYSYSQAPVSGYAVVRTTVLQSQT